MLLTSTVIVAEDQDAANAPGGDDDDAVVGALVAQVRSAFPDLLFSRAIVEERGGDHRMLLLDDTFAFRFPRETTHDLRAEISVLAALRGRCGIALPDYRFVDPAGRFAGYRFIVGDELTPERFGTLSGSVQDRVLDQVGRFLAALHGLDPRDVLPAGRWPTVATPARQAAHARAERLPRIARAFPELAQPLDVFYDTYSRNASARRVPLHGDLVDDHILLACDRTGLAGIIDFGDVALGDPAQDLLGLWAYGSDAVARVIAAYGAGADHDLHARSHRAFIRYRIDRFAELLASDGKDAAERSLPALTALLPMPGAPGDTAGATMFPRLTDQSTGDDDERSESRRPAV